MSWTANIITLFPEVFPGTLGISVIGKALENRIWQLRTFNLRNYVINNGRVDDTPYGGLPGMLLRPDVMETAIKDVFLCAKNSDIPIYFTSPKGKILNNDTIRTLTSFSEILLICGRFEGIDNRIIDYYNIQEISIGDYIISGGEAASMVILDSCIRTLPGVLGNPNSLSAESFSKNMLLEHPQYTRPAIWHNIPVPEVLTSGHHENIKNWCNEQSQNITSKLRPDLLKKEKDINE